ncbi:MAG: DUF1501 domain-containing protein [Planctomycetaceae bacterium]|nr:DUF1501 domain-containing protein [Planctomycetaceae bacterium]
MRSNRREFLRTTLGSSAILSLGATLPDFLRAAAATGTDDKDTILVVVQLSGGNDGLNTVIPFSDPAYKKARPTLAIPTSDVLKIDDTLGFHPSARGLADLLEDDSLAIVQGVGYDNPNRSHFESMDIWHTCQRKSDTRTTGWLGRYLDATQANKSGASLALHLGHEKQPLALTATGVSVPSISSLESFRLNDSGDKEVRSTISKLAASKQDESDSLLGFLQSTTTVALAASQRVEQASRDYKTPVTYPDSELAKKLKTVAQLIDSGLGTRVYYVTLDGFDTHSQQPAAHAALLSQLGGAVSSFVKDIDHHGQSDRVAVLAFSEFGRRVAENASEGTDHGAAAPMFLAGKKVRAGLIGKHPSLTDLEDGDLKFHTDFRQVYATVLESWLGWPNESVLGGKFKTVEAFSA